MPDDAVKGKITYNEETGTLSFPESDPKEVVLQAEAKTFYRCSVCNKFLEAPCPEHGEEKKCQPKE